VLVRPVTTGPSYDPTEGSPIEKKVKILILNYSSYEIGQGRVKATDKKVLLQKGNLAFDPETTDKLRIDGIEHQIVGPDDGNGIKPLRPANVTIYYELQCRT
jgi:hypothetical protein